MIRLQYFVVALAVLIVNVPANAVSLDPDRYRCRYFPPPNGGDVCFTIDSGNPACASYNGRDCLWGVSKDQIDFSKLHPLVCGGNHLKAYGVTGFEDPKHWCSLAKPGE
jgi:hypothetical protein